MRWYGRGIDRCHEVRRRLAYYVAKHGFEIGDYSLGDPTVRLYNVSRLKIGKYCSIAAGATFIMGGNHRTDTVMTGYFERQKIGPGEYPFTRGDIVVGSDVWIASNAMILSGVTIGDGAVVGAGSVVLHDVPPYAIVFGNPARVVRKRFSDELVAALLELRWWDLTPEQIQPLRPLLQSDHIREFVAECRKVKGLPPLQEAEKSAAPVERENAPIAVPSASSALSSADAVAFIQSEFPAISSADLNTPLDRLDVDSFGMLTLRTKLEQALQAPIEDPLWTSVITPADVIRIVTTAAPQDIRVTSATPVTQRRVYSLNLPQMALSGLSEAWLFKEVGDMHWSLITDGLRMPSSQVKDSRGNRLYATFTCFQMHSTAPLAAYVENETVAIDAKVSRYGSAMFFNNATVRGDGKSAQIRIMSIFSKFGEVGANTSLLKGQPKLPPDCEIPAVTELPEIGREYRAQRGAPFTPPIFECEYEIIPYHDINGVGLLYFAAYPIISDICAMRYAGRSVYAKFSTSSRQVFYFSNCDPDETLIYRIHRWRANEQSIELEDSISRKSDGVLMAYILTKKDRFPA